MDSVGDIRRSTPRQGCGCTGGDGAEGPWGEVSTGRKTKKQLRDQGSPSAMQGDRGPIECTLTYDEWCKEKGYTPGTGMYDQEPQPVNPVVVVQLSLTSGSNRGQAKD
jgi:hypothetical protein